ncbi:MAG: hypothetical protein HOG15_07455, partial [Anaerolineae bacterium]|nr:hypothetical protein [Anaerolineae bacterium]
MPRRPPHHRLRAGRANHRILQKKLGARIHPCAARQRFRLRFGAQKNRLQRGRTHRRRAGHCAKTSYKVSPITRSGYAQNVIPFWQDKALRDRILAEMTSDWHATFEAGIFTEFMEQRAPGHTVLDGKIYTRGMLGFKRDIELTRRTLD